MGWLDLFKRGEAADEALHAVARHHGWSATAASGLAMLPPSHAVAGMHELESRHPPSCAGSAYALTLGPCRCAAIVSHLEIFQSDDEHSVYDMVTWLRPAGSVPRFEAELGSAAWQHHRLGDRFQPSGSDSQRLQGGVVLRMARSTDPARVQAWSHAPGWAALKAQAEGRDGLRGCVAEGLGDRVAVFTWAAMPRQGRQRWRDLVQVAQGLEALIAGTG